MIRSDL